MEILRQLALAALAAAIRLQYPDVPTVTVAELRQRLADDRPPPLLLDTREPAEFAVSHLPGARNLASVEAVRQAAVPSDAPLVVYCTVGYRSAGLARRLRSAGYSDVANLQGSIVRWHQRGLPLVRDGVSVDTVHPYDDFWGLLLDPSSRATR
jgi:rhodanese-related sulfurtransferase